MRLPRWLARRPGKDSAEQIGPHGVATLESPHSCCVAAVRLGSPPFLLDVGWREFLGDHCVLVGVSDRGRLLWGDHLELHDPSIPGLAAVFVLVDASSSRELDARCYELITRVQDGGGERIASMAPP